MNERIKELLRQATLVETYTATDGTIHEGKQVDIEKFAELIVLECQSRVGQYISDCGEIGSLPDTVIKKHFGAEE